ncbi:MAG: hypothetical protein EHM72_14200, partial [Calditrichaeota bacterium]
HLVNGLMPAGVYSLIWDGLDDQGQQVSSGAYLCRLTAGMFTQTRKMMLVR